MEILLYIIILIVGLCRESYRKHKADQYADMVVRKHNNGGTPKT